jgi:hypothetical protein
MSAIDPMRKSASRISKAAGSDLRSMERLGQPEPLLHTNIRAAEPTDDAPIREAV